MTPSPLPPPSPPPTTKNCVGMNCECVNVWMIDCDVEFVNTTQARSPPSPSPLPPTPIYILWILSLFSSLLSFFHIMSFLLTSLRLKIFRLQTFWSQIFNSIKGFWRTILAYSLTYLNPSKHIISFFILYLLEPIQAYHLLFLLEQLLFPPFSTK